MNVPNRKNLAAKLQKDCDNSKFGFKRIYCRLFLLFDANEFIIFVGEMVRLYA